MVSLERFELLELRREGPIQTYHAREIATARPVQVHFFTVGYTPETAPLLSMIDRLPDAERRRVLDRGESRGLPYIVTDRLAGYADFREWVTANARGAPPIAVRPPTIDEQFYALFDAAPAPAAAPPRAAPPPAIMGPAAFSAAAVQASHVPAPLFSAAPPAPEAQLTNLNGPAAPMRTGPPQNSSLLNASIEIEALEPRRRLLPTAAKALLWLFLGILAALAVLVGIAAFLAFRPR